MIVKDLLDSCNIENVTSTIMEIASVDESDRLSVKKAHSLYIQRIRSIEPVNTDHVVFGVSFLNDGKETPDALLFSKNEIDENLLSASMLSTLKNTHSLDLNDIEQILDTTTLPVSYAFEFSPWNEILGYELFIPNVNSFGADKLLAVIIYEMTFCGFTEEDHQKEVQKLREAIAETESIQSLPEEERKKYYKNAEDVLDITTLELRKKSKENKNSCTVKPSLIELIPTKSLLLIMIIQSNKYLYLLI
jgi:hypothetical protein